MAQIQNKRHFYRLVFPQPVCADMKFIPLTDAHSDGPEMDTTRVAIIDLSGGGIKFLSPVHIPENFHTLLEFRFILLNRPIKVLGQIVRRTDEPNVYCARLTLNDSDQGELVQVINTLTVMVRKNQLLENCSLCTREELSQLKGQ